MEGYQFVTWSTLQTCEPELYFEPSTLDELREILERARTNNRKVRVCGSHHSFNHIACTDGYMISLHKFTRVLEVDSRKNTIRVEAGITLKQLCEEVLPKQGLALSVLSMIYDQSLAGAISTGTHGTGTKFGMMATYLNDLDIMKASGEIVRCSREENPDLFNAAQCGLGVLGIIVSATIQCEPAFKLHEKVTPIKFERMVANLDGYAESGEHVTFNVVPHTENATIMVSNRTDRDVTPEPKPSWFWDWLIGQLAVETLLWISSYCERLVPWINAAFFRCFLSHPTERVADSHRVFLMPIPLVADVIEWAVPRENAADVLRQLKVHWDAERFYAHIQCLVRFVKADDVMISPCYKRDVCYINIIHAVPFGRKTQNAKLWTIVADVMKNADGIAHWGKVPEPRDYKECMNTFPMWEKFCEIRKNVDPEGTFLNRFLEDCLNE